MQTLLWILVGSRKVFKLLAPIAKGTDREDGMFYLYIVCSDPQQSQQRRGLVSTLNMHRYFC